MSAVFSAAEFAAATGGSWVGGSPAISLAISTDTRSDNRGKLFLALSGERFDAHDFLDRAVASGACALCIDEKKIHLLPPQIPALAVKDTLKALQDCAAFHRQRFPQLKLFGVTGSVGKTSVKEMLRAICTAASSPAEVLATEGNTNNQIGVAQNLLKLTGAIRYAIIEAGTSSPGEIAPLGRIMAPTGAIVNSIAPCHLEKLIDLNGVAAEKSELLKAVLSGGFAVYPADAAGKNILDFAADGKKSVTFGLADSRADHRAEFVCGSLDGSTIRLLFPDGTSREFSWHLTGRHNALNAAGAAALASCAGIAPDTIVRGLQLTALPGMRMKKCVIGEVTYINDAYNANPRSMAASLTMLTDAGVADKLILVLGGMRELGDGSAAAHAATLQQLREAMPEARYMTWGSEFAGISENHFTDLAAARDHLTEITRPGDIVFAKGSRGNAVEQILPPEAR